MNHHFLILVLNQLLELFNLLGELAALVLQSHVVEVDAPDFVLLLLVAELGLRVAGRLQPRLHCLAHNDLACLQFLDHLEQCGVLRLQLDDFFSHLVRHSVLLLDVPLLLGAVF